MPGRWRGSNARANSHGRPGQGLGHGLGLGQGLGQGGKSPRRGGRARVEPGDMAGLLS